jgi:hypothetical protein
MTKAEYHQSVTIARVLCELLALEIRSNLAGPVSARLEAQVGTIGERYARFAKRNITTKAERARMRRRVQSLFGKGRRR